MTKLKTISIFKYIYVLIIITTVVSGSYRLLNFPKSKYYIDETTIKGTINQINIDGNNLKITLNGKEKVLVNYYFKSESEKLLAFNDYKLGQTISLIGYFKLPEVNRNFNLFNYRNYLLSLKINYIFIAEKIIIESSKINLPYSIKNKINKRLNSLNDPSYVKAFLLGSTEDINPEIMNSYQENGVNHLFAISGMHITLLSYIFLNILSLFSKKSNINYLITILFLLFYMFLTNFTPSVIRATLLFIAFTIKNYIYIPFKSAHILIFIACLLLLYNPYYIYHLGFQFSFIISFYLIICSKLINKYSNYLYKTFITSFIAFLTSIPILINNFFTINIFSIFINIFFVPFVSFLIFPIALFTFIFPFASFILNKLTTLMEVTSLMFNEINFLTFYFSKVPIIIFLIYYIFITLILDNIQYYRYRYITIFVICLFIHYHINFFKLTPTISLIDVGQGDSILIQLPHNRGNVLVDTGGIVRFNQQSWQIKNREFEIGASVVVPYIKSVGIKKLDYLIITHGDYDHIGGAESVIRNIPTNNVIFNSGNINELEDNLINILKLKKIPHQFMSEGAFKLNNYPFYFLNKKNLTSENKDSLIILTIINDKKILLMGDSGFLEEEYIMNKYDITNIDVLKIGHHGSKNSTSKEFLDKTTPKYYLSSSGVNNMYNHPHPDVVKLINSRTNKYYSTNTNGNVILYLADKIRVKTRFRD